MPHENYVFPPAAGAVDLTWPIHTGNLGLHPIIMAMGYRVKKWSRLPTTGIDYT